jgi:hypothetical protein
MLWSLEFLIWTESVESALEMEIGWCRKENGENSLGKMIACKTTTKKKYLRVLDDVHSKLFHFSGNRGVDDVVEMSQNVVSTDHQVNCQKKEKKKN